MNLIRRLARWSATASFSTTNTEKNSTPIRDLVAGVLGSYSTTVLNVGARWGDEGAWWKIDPVASSVGFDPDPVECERLNALCKSPRTERYLPLALGARNGEATLYRTKEPACSSVYPPMEALSERFPQLEVIRTMDQQLVHLTTLDDWWTSEEQPDVSFLKIDTQGSELDILRGATQLLQGALGCEVEVEFSPIYRGQPLFSDVDGFLRSQGFSLWRLNDLCHYSEQPEAGEKGRLYWANAVYLRDYRTLGQSDEEWRQSMILAVLLEALGDRVAARSCVKQALQGLGEPTEAPRALELSENPA